MQRRCTATWLAGFCVAASLAGVGLAQVAGAAKTSSANEFDAPSGLTFGGGHLWVTNGAGNSVTEINPSNGNWVATFRASRDGFNQPSAITNWGPDLFVANTSGGVTELRDSGALVRVVSGARYHFIDPVAIHASGNVVLVLNAGNPSAATPVAGSITEFSARTGAFIRRLAGPSFAFSNPAAFTISGPDLFIADENNNSVTEATIAGALVRVVAGQGLSSPDGIAVEDGMVWVSDSGSNSATRINASTGAVVATDTDADADYGFGHPSVVIAAEDNVYIASPFSTSPMVTKVGATSGVPSWFMCNTNGPYYFSLLSAFAISGNDLWVASRSGANSATPAAATGSLTEMNIGDGSLIATFPTPPASTTTSTTTTTTTTTAP
jgi:outer membrane protein assembly factor BamB